MTGAVAIRRAHLTARFDASSVATLSELEPLRYESAAELGLPGHVRAASAVRRFAQRLVIVQDDVNALAVRDSSGAVRPVLLPPHSSGRRVFDDAHGNKRDKLDLEACVSLREDLLVAIGSGSTPGRERLVAWNGRDAPIVVDGASLYRDLRDAVTRGATRLNIEGAVVMGTIVKLFHRGNDARGVGANAIADVDSGELASWLAGRGPSPRIAGVTTADLGDTRGVPFGFTDAAVLDAEHVVVLACAEDSACAISDGAVLGARVGVLEREHLRMVDVCDASGVPTRLKLEGIETRPGDAFVFDVVADIDLPSAPAQLGRLTWRWR
jgi:hypothetical protein